MNITNRLTDVAKLIRYRYIPMQNLYSPLYFVQVYDLNINRVEINSSRGCGILGINILGNSSLIYSSFAGNMFNAFIIYLDLVWDTSAYSVATFSVLVIANTNFWTENYKLQIYSRWTYSDITTELLSCSVIINNATFQENKGFSCSSINVDTSQCSSIALKMEEITMAGGVALTIWYFTRSRRAAVFVWNTTCIL